MTPSRFWSSAEWACKTARSIIRGSGAPTRPLPGPMDDGDLLAAGYEELAKDPEWQAMESIRRARSIRARLRHAEEENEVLEPWVGRAVEAKEAREASRHPSAECGCHFCASVRVLRRRADEPCTLCPDASDAAGATAASVESDLGAGSPLPAPSVLTWVEYVTPAICEVLAGHYPDQAKTGEVYCFDAVEGLDHHLGPFDDWQEWREHVSALIAERLSKVSMPKGER